MFEITTKSLGVSLSIAAVFVGLQAGAVAAVSVTNGDFEADASLWVTWPGYTGGANPVNITGWTGAGGRGINPVVPGAAGDSPFDDPSTWNKTRFAFLQGSAHIEQSITGFSVGGQYMLSIDFSSRGCCGGALPAGLVTLDGNPIAATLALFPPSGAIPVPGAAAPWYHADVPFKATAVSHVLRIATEPVPSGDSTLVVDNVKIAPIPEPSAGLFAALAGMLGLRRRR